MYIISFGANTLNKVGNLSMFLMVQEGKFVISNLLFSCDIDTNWLLLDCYLCKCHITYLLYSSNSTWSTILVLISLRLSKKQISTYCINNHIFYCLYILQHQEITKFNVWHWYQHNTFFKKGSNRSTDRRVMEWSCRYPHKELHLKKCLKI